MPGGCEGGGEVREVWGAYHERERLCPEGVRVVERCGKCGVPTMSGRGYARRV